MDFAHVSNPQARPAPRRRLRLSEYGWGRRALLIVAALVGSAAFAYAANLASRNALWQVVRACALDQTTAGSPLPCLEVNLADGVERGYAVLRPPVGQPDTILTPTRRIVGLEDPQLQAPGRPTISRSPGRPGAGSPRPIGRRRRRGASRSPSTRGWRARRISCMSIIGCLAPSFAQTPASAGARPKAAGMVRRGTIWRAAWNFGPIAAAPRIAAISTRSRLLREIVGDETMLRRTTLGGGAGGQRIRRRRAALAPRRLVRLGGGPYGIAVLAGRDVAPGRHAHGARQKPALDGALLGEQSDLDLMVRVVDLKLSS